MNPPTADPLVDVNPDSIGDIGQAREALKARDRRIAALQALLRQHQMDKQRLDRTLAEIETATRAVQRSQFAERIPIRGNDPAGRLAQALNEMAAELEGLAQLRAHFLSKVSHELRSPLARIKLLTVTALRTNESNDQQRYLTLINSETDLLTRLVDDLLEMSRLDSGHLQPRLRWCQLGELVEGAVASQQPRAERQGVRLTYVELCRAEEAAVFVDPERTHQIVDNLLDNALKYTPAGGEIIVSINRQADRVLVTVSDTGEGIPSGALEHIFERFFQADPSRSGTGLGLFVVKELAEAQGGGVMVHSALGEGSVFTVWLPAHAKTPRGVADAAGD